jgi:uncharacterized Ntn-hydrolase superfamily protein
VAFLDPKGRVAGHTGSKCLPHAGGIQGEGFSVQANLMHTGKVWSAMAKSFESSKGALSERLMGALEAAEAAGGDRRGRQSAAILIVSTDKTPDPWKGRLLDLRVEDHPYPLKELRRLLGVHAAYEHANRGDELVAEKNFREALKEYRLASDGAPAIEELRFWEGVTLLDSGKVKEAMAILRSTFKERDDWRELLGELPAYGLLHVEPRLLKKIVSGHQVE